MKDTKAFDVIIIGGSYAGLSAALALGRALRKVLVIDSGAPCNQQTPHSHNFLTQDGATPLAIATVAKQQLAAYPGISFKNATVTAVKESGNTFLVTTDDGAVWTTSKVLLATGVKNIMPDLPGFKDCWGISVLHCPYCHGYEVRNQATGILASGTTGFEIARLIHNWTKNLTLFTNEANHLSPEQLKKLAAHDIKIVEKEIKSLLHEQGHINAIEFTDGQKQELKAIYARPAFVQHSTLAQEIGCLLTEDGFIQTDEFKKTSVPGIYAAGDNTTPFRSVASAIAAGTTAGALINHELITEQF